MEERKDMLNKVICGDCVEVMSQMKDESIDMVLTSPPYDAMRDYKGCSEVDFNAIATELYRLLKKGGVLVWVIADETIRGNETGTSFKHALGFKDVGFNLFDTMIYLKQPRGAVGSNKTYWQTFEYMFVLSKGQPKTINLIKDRENKDTRKGDSGTKRLKNGKLIHLKRAGYEKMGRRTNVWTYNVGNGHSATDNIAKEHPAVFPEKLAEDHILSWSNKYDLVLDPFTGSGTTLKMCTKNSRNFVGIDIVPDYCNIARKRVKIAVDDKKKNINKRTS